MDAACVRLNCTPPVAVASHTNALLSKLWMQHLWSAAFIWRSLATALFNPQDRMSLAADEYLQGAGHQAFKAAALQWHQPPAADQVNAAALQIINPPHYTFMARPFQQD
jgi:hypothetical protein